MSEGEKDSKRPTLVILDDQKSTLTLAKSFAGSKGFNAVTIHVTPEASTSIKELEGRVLAYKPDMVLTDLRMGTLPGMKDGELAGLKLREALNNSNPGLPVIIQTTELDKVPNHHKLIAEPKALKAGYPKPAMPRPNLQFYTDAAAYFNIQPSKASAPALN